MNRIVVFEDHGFVNLLPLVYWRSVCELRRGRRSLIDRIHQGFPIPIEGLWTRDWIADVTAERFSFAVNAPLQEGTLLVNARWWMGGGVRVQKAPFVGIIGDDVAYVACDQALIQRLSPAVLLDQPKLDEMLRSAPRDVVAGAMIRYPWDLLADQGAELEAAWRDEFQGGKGEMEPGSMVRRPEYVHLGERARVAPGAVLDAQDGPIFINEKAIVGSHAVIVGPASIGKGATVNPHAYLHGGTTVGSYCKIGGEVHGCTFSSYSNKQHDGFLGHSYVGSWVNLGASTVNSDLKNTYGNVRCPVNGVEVDTGQMFVGAIIADHVKTAIGTRLPTGCTLGFAANLACSKMTPKFVSSYGWLTDDGMAAGDPRRLAATAAKVMSRRQLEMTKAEFQLFQDLPARVREYERSQWSVKT